VSWLKDTGDAIVRFFDPYSLRARLLPAILGAAPALAAVLLLISWRTFELSSIVGVLGLSRPGLRALGLGAEGRQED
jgi:hypothetical protein